MQSLIVGETGSSRLRLPQEESSNNNLSTKNKEKYELLRRTINEATQNDAEKILKIIDDFIRIPLLR